jgi:hypothetical protein
MMAMKWIPVVACSFVLLFSQNTPAQDTENPIYRYSQRTLLKNWALSRCLGRVAVNQQSRDDAYATAAAYLEFGSQGMDAYESLQVLVDKYAAKTYSGSIKSDFNTMKCIDLFHSEELSNAVKRFSRQKHKHPKKGSS